MEVGCHRPPSPVYGPRYSETARAVLIDRIFAVTSRYPALHRLVRPLGGPVYRRLLALNFERARRRTGWAFPQTIAPATGLQIATGRYEPATSNLLRRVLRPDDVFFDIGANVGYFSTLAARAVGPGGRVLAIEPELENFCCLVQNTRALPQVMPMACACADSEGLVSLRLSSHAACHSIVASGGYLDSGARLTPALTFDRVFALIGAPESAVVKIDVEGAEPLVLRGMREALAKKRVRHLIIEYGPQLLLNAGFDPRELWGTLTAHFRLANVEDGRPLDTLQAFDDLTAQFLAQPRPTTVNLWGNML